MNTLEQRLESLRAGVGDMQCGLPGDEGHCTAAEVIDAALAELRRLRGELNKAIVGRNDARGLIFDANALREVLAGQRDLAFRQRDEAKAQVQRHRMTAEEREAVSFSARPVAGDALMDVFRERMRGYLERTKEVG